MTRAHVITVSDGAFHGRREDTSGAAVLKLLAANQFESEAPEVVPDEQGRITAAIAAAATAGARLVVTTGGTGLGPRDVTPQATRAAIDYEVPGLAERMRRVGEASTPMAAISRAMAGVRGTTLVINLPGSPKGALESLEAIFNLLAHVVELASGRPVDHG